MQSNILVLKILRSFYKKNTFVAPENSQIRVHDEPTLGDASNSIPTDGISSISASDSAAFNIFNVTLFTPSIEWLRPETGEGVALVCETTTDELVLTCIVEIACVLIPESSKAFFFKAVLIWEL